jgi:hypothetical protein
MTSTRTTDRSHRALRPAGGPDQLPVPEIKARLAGLGVDPTSMTSAAFGKFIADEIEKWGNVIRALNIKAE